MQDLQQELAQKLSRLDQLVCELKASGTQYSQNEHDYRVALRLAILAERHKGTPVTIIHDLVRGQQDIAEMRMRRDNAEAIHQATLEAINTTKLQIRIIEAQIAREWSTYQGGQNVY